MSLIWAALIFAAGIFAGGTLAFLTIVLIARAVDEPESLYRGGESQ